MTTHGADLYKKTLRSIYSGIPFKRAMLHGLRRIWHPPQNIYKHLYFNGEFQVDISEKSFRVIHYGYEFENCIFWSGLTGDWEGKSMSLWMDLCRNNNVIYDIGANTGIFALVAKAITPNAEVHAFEPVKRVFQKLEMNNKLNAFDIHCVEKALSNRDGFAKIYDQPTDHVYSVTVNENLAPQGTAVVEVQIATERFDTYFKSLGAKAALPTLMKIDVETHEPEVLAGMGDILSQARPDLLIEILNESVGARVEQILKNLNYRYYNIDEVGKPKRQQHLGKSDHWNFLVCKPETALRLGLPE